MATSNDPDKPSGGRLSLFRFKRDIPQRTRISDLLCRRAKIGINFHIVQVGKFATQEATGTDGSAVVTAQRYPRVLLEHLLLANQINERLNAKRKKLRINTTQMLILAVLPPMEGRTLAQAVTIKELAAQLQLGRKTVSAQLKGMVEDGLVEVADPTANEDRRCMRHRMTRAGQAKALHVWQVLGALDSVFRALLGDKLTRSHPQTIRLLVNGLPTAPSLDNARRVDRFCEQMSRKRSGETLARKAKGT